MIVGQGPAGAVVDSGSGFQNLNNLVPAGSGFALTNAVAVNNNGRSSPTAETTRPARTTPSSYRLDSDVVFLERHDAAMGELVG